MMMVIQSGKTKTQLGIAVPGLHDVIKTCDGEGELVGETNIYAFIDTTSGPYSINDTSQGNDNRAVIFDALSEWFINYKLENQNFNGKLYIAVTKNNSQAEFWLKHTAIVCSDNYNLRTDILNTGIDGTSTGIGTTVDMLGKWVTSSSHDGYSWTTDGEPPNWSDAEGYVIPNRIFMIEFCNEAANVYHATYDEIPTYTNFSSNQPTDSWKTHHSEFVTIHNSLDYFGGLVYPVSSTGQNTHLHMYSAVEGGTTVNRDDFI